MKKLKVFKTHILLFSVGLVLYIAGSCKMNFPISPPQQALNPDPKEPSFSLLKAEREINLPADSAVGLMSKE